MNAYPIARKRVLIIGADCPADFIRAGHVAGLFSKSLISEEKQNGRRYGALYTTVDGKNPVYVWSTETQITVHLYPETQEAGE